MARKDVVKFVCDACGRVEEDEMCCEEPMHGYPKGWSSVTATLANGTNDCGNKWHDICPDCQGNWNALLIKFFTNEDLNRTDQSRGHRSNFAHVDEAIDRDALKIVEDAIEKYSENRDLYCFSGFRDSTSDERGDTDG